MSDIDGAYCRHCGSESLKYIEQYANGCEWECKTCGNVFISEKYDGTAFMIETPANWDQKPSA